MDGLLRPNHRQKTAHQHQVMNVEDWRDEADDWCTCHQAVAFRGEKAPDLVALYVMNAESACPVSFADGQQLHPHSQLARSCSRAPFHARKGLMTLEQPPNNGCGLRHSTLATACCLGLRSCTA